MSLAYKVEELLALRDSISESAVSIDKFADEDVIKEHVLRPSASANLARALENTFRPSTTPALVPALPNKRPSPSQSIKRGKAEKLIKEHGSPPGMRVTAGGRVVPSDLPPLNNSRLASNTYKPHALRGVVPSDCMSTQAQSDANVARIELIGNQAVVRVGDRMFALPAVSTANSTMLSAVPGLMDTATKSTADPTILSTQGNYPGASSTHPPRPCAQNQYTALDLGTLKAQQTLKKQELRTVEQTEVLQAGHQSDVWRAGMIEKKRGLIVELDALRKQISAAEADNAPSNQTNAFPGPNGPTAATAPPPPVFPQYQQAIPQPMYAYAAGNPYAPLVMYQPPFGAFPSMPPTEPPQFVHKPVNEPHSPGSAGRRSHAIEIKPPRDEAKKQSASTLDPKSPTYEPVSKVDASQKISPPTPSPPKHSPWRCAEVAQLSKREDRAISQKPSLSSIDTTDFFPTNTHEYSSTRVAPKIKDSKQSSNENAAVPSTPEKKWPASPWNEGNSGRSKGPDPLIKLTSWPEAFGKQPSLSSLRPPESTQPTPGTQERASLASTDAVKPNCTNNISARKSSDGRTGTDENWPLVHSRPVIHVPSTYQEGYQAGYDHIGIPDSPEVLKGFIQGLLQFMSDESKKGRMSLSGRALVGGETGSGSLRGLVVGSMPHDSAVSMSFNRTEAPIGSQENVRAAKESFTMGDIRRDSAYMETNIPYTLCNEATQDPRFSNSSGVMYNSLEMSDKVGSGYKHIATAGSESEIGRRTLDKGTISRGDVALSNHAYPRVVSGNQLSSRTLGTPVSMQRYFPTPKENGSRILSGEVPSYARPAANKRFSGLDGAMDDLADVILDTHLDEQPPATEGRTPIEAIGQSEGSDLDASGCKPFSGKGKQKLVSSPTKSIPSRGRETATSSPANPSGSPKKSGEHSPAKAKLEQVTNKFRRPKEGDPRYMSPEEKATHVRKWHRRFQKIRKDELKEIDDYVRTHPRD